MILQLVLAVSCAVIISALCSIMEASLYAIPKSQIELLNQSGKKSGRLLKQLTSDIHKPITAILTLNTIANTMGAAVAGASAAAVFGEQNLGWFSASFTLVILLFSEILPKTTGVAYSRTLAPFFSYLMNWMVKILSPVIWLCQAVTKIVPYHQLDSLVSADEIQAVAALSRKSGEIAPQEERVITNILELRDKTVKQVMTPRTVTFVLSEHLSINEAKNKKERWDLHSRVPLYDKDSDDIVGIVLRKDVLLYAAEGLEEKKLSEMMHPVHFVPEIAPLNKVLADFFEKRQHLFVVVDEYGGFTGVISLEDIIEEIVGHEIMDETDTTQDMRELARHKRRILTAHALRK